MNQIFTILLFSSFLIFISCDKDEVEVRSSETEFSDKVAFNPEKDSEIQRYNLEVRKERTRERKPCDTISVIEFVLDNFEEGTYVVEFDKEGRYDIPDPALIYYNQNEKRYIFTVIAKSRSGERLIEPKNIIGYDQSLIDLDSTKLGTAFFYLILFECKNNSLDVVWESVIPSHGGFNYIQLKKWNFKNIPFVEVNFHYARGTGHINYNYFLFDGIDSEPHLLMTYKGIDFKRTIANVNNDKFPDYYEHIYYSLKDKIYSPDSVAFTWREKDSVYVNSRNSKQTRPY